MPVMCQTPGPYVIYTGIINIQQLLMRYDRYLSFSLLIFDMGIIYENFAKPEVALGLLLFLPLMNWHKCKFGC